MNNNYLEITANGQTYKAYYTLENLYRIERMGISLTQLAVDTINAPPSLSQTRDILLEALRAEIPNLEIRGEFVRDFIDQNRFLAATTMQQFIHKALTAPETEDGEATEKKNEAA